MRFLAYDGWLMTALRNLTAYVLLGLLWVITSIPIITFGASTVAMFFTAEKSIHNDYGSIFSTFWDCFRREFKQATALWLIAFVFTALLGISCYLALPLKLTGLMLVILLIAVAICAGWMQLWFGYLSKFEDSIKVLLRNTFVMTLMNILWVVLLMIIVFAAVAGIIISILTINIAGPLFIPGIYVMLSSMVMRKIFRKYLPQESKEKLEEEGETPEE